MNSQEFMTYTTEQWSVWMDKLATDDYVVIDHFISDRLYQNMQHYFQALLDESEFDKAAIGSSDQRKVESEIRGDFIYWLDPKKDAELSELFSLLDSVVINLKEHLFLSISDYEFHFALYPPNTHYEKHIDQFKGQSNRVISVLIYLNDDWKPGNGGELKIYRPDGSEQLIEPLAKRMVMFKSDTVEHEVMLTKTQRRSLTGWLLHRSSSLKYLF